MLLVTGAYIIVSVGHTASIYNFAVNPKIRVFPDEEDCGFSADLTLRDVWEDSLQCPRTAELAFATKPLVRVPGTLPRRS